MPGTARVLALATAALTVLLAGGCGDSPIEPGAVNLRIVVSTTGVTYELTDVHPGCRVEGANPRTVSAAIGAVAELSFGVVCGETP